MVFFCVVSSISNIFFEKEKRKETKKTKGRFCLPHQQKKQPFSDLKLFRFRDIDRNGKQRGGLGGHCSTLRCRQSDKSSANARKTIGVFFALDCTQRWVLRFSGGSRTCPPDWPDWALSPQKIWKSLPYSRLFGEGRTGVGHRRWVRQDTPALRPQPERSQPSTPEPCSLSFSKRHQDSATRPASPPTPACRTGEAGRQNQGGAGGIISPACLSCLYSLSAFSAFFSGFDDHELRGGLGGRGQGGHRRERSRRVRWRGGRRVVFAFP